ncbi:MAG: type VII secretion protein EssC [Lachnospiraceae bacterium]|nr:type VII secretion protein EssC [Lachnospiraceae bacterium]
MESRLPKITEKFYQRKQVVMIASEYADIVIADFPYQIWIEEDKIYLEMTGLDRGYVFHNEKELDQGQSSFEIAFQEGDSLYFSQGSITVYQDYLVIAMSEGCYESALLELAPNQVPFEGFPKYKRSPRLIKKVPTEKIEINTPPAAKKMEKRNLIQVVVPPLVMLCVTISVSILMRRGLFVVISAISTVMSLIMSVSKFVKDRKELKEQEQKRQDMYDSYLLSVRKRLYNALEAEKDAVHYNNPTIEAIEQMINTYSSRIYERNTGDDDFLKVMIGSSDEKVSFPLSMKSKEMEMNVDPLELEARKLYSSFLMLKNKPVCIDLKQAHLGLVGEKNIIHEQIKLIVAQLAFFHSYHDLEIITIYHEKYNENFKWMNWYPHLRIHAINTYGCINNERMRDHVIGSMYRILKDRKLKREESRKESRFLPHYLFIIDEPKLIADHAIMEYLDKESDGLGFSIIYTTHMRANLPENIRTVVQYEHSEQGTLVIEQGEMIDKKLKLQRVGRVDFEMMARNLSVLVHEKGIISQIPESVTFFDMYHVETPAQLKIEERWQSNQSYKTLAVPLGLRGVEDYLYLNLHEKAHGPHGLVAGTTGSGKSEIVQSYILSLAVNFHPHEVGFLLIDYKGGGMAGLFKDLPHLLGTITNLDGSESMRAMASIKSELARRQKIFSQNNVNHINDYNKLFKLGEVTEPLPHLFLISDEFAELKKEQPEFMTELVSAARIGRSLGIHLILATQKPSGVVDDQIWTNSRFKLALKVQNESDSREIIKTTDAAFITQPGRAYLQVGNNEIYELFQSAWSGAPHRNKQDAPEKGLVYLVNELGQGELINNDLSGIKESGQLEATQLDVTVSYIADVYYKLNVQPVKKPWLPPLSGRIASPSLAGYEWNVNREINSQPLNLTAEIGYIDIPEEQSQVAYRMDLMKDGNVAFFAASGYGKSTFLTTVILSLAMNNSVALLNFYICDFGNSALIPCNALPHTADYITVDDTEKMEKLMRILNEEIKVRKKLFADKMVQNFDVYNQIATEGLKAIVLIVDNYDVVREISQELDDFLAKLSRDGVGLGIYMVVTATRQNGIKYVALNNYKNKIAGYLVEKTEASGLVGKSAYQPPEIEGRVLVKHGTTACLMQVYTMTKFKNEMEYNTGIQELIAKISEMYPTMRAPRIPMLPENFDSTMLTSYSGDMSGKVALGLHKEIVELRGVDRGTAPFVILGDSGRGKTNLLKVIVEQLLGTGKIYVFDSSSKELFYLKERDMVSYVEIQFDVEDFIENWKEEIATRRKRFHMALEEDARLSPKEFYTTLDPFYIIIDDADELAENYKAIGKAMAECLRLAIDTGCGIFVTIHSTKAKAFDEVSKLFKIATEGILIGNPGSTSIFPPVATKQLPSAGEGLLYHSGGYERIVLPKYISKMEGEED